MFSAMEGSRAEVMPSAYWTELNERSVRHLRETGYEHFKRSLATHYFTWVPALRDAQFRFLARRLPPSTVVACAARALLAERHEPFARKQSAVYSLLTFLLWEYARRNDPDRLLDRLDEPSEGDPPRLRLGGRRISQDLANSMLEYRSVAEAGLAGRVRTVLELGAGYGRTAFVFLRLQPGVKYRIVDIPPALYVAERYLAGQFADRRVFRFRPFASYAAVAAELEAADIAFLLPRQLELLPDRSADLFVNISSLHEMRPDQIAYYFGQIDRLTRGWFYTKQWKESRNPADGLVIREDDYPVPAHWRRVYSRPCAVQTYFFEALYEVGGPPRS
jgi:putative sugar O-methyltransferase